MEDSCYKLIDCPNALLGSGIYFLLLKGNVVYVEQSVFMCNRISWHFMQAQNNFDQVKVFPCDEADLDRWEAHFIRTLKPCLNKQQPQFIEPKIKLQSPVINRAINPTVKSIIQNMKPVPWRLPYNKLDRTAKTIEQTFVLEEEQEILSLL